MADTVTENLHIAIEDTVVKIRELMAEHGKVVSGKTAHSLRRDGWNIMGADYYRDIIYGRRPGRVPKDFPTILLRWAKAKGITFQTPQEASSWARATAIKIEEEGTVQYRNRVRLDILDNARDYLQERADTLIKDEFRIAIAEAVR